MATRRDFRGTREGARLVLGMPVRGVLVMVVLAGAMFATLVARLGKYFAPVIFEDVR